MSLSYHDLDLTDFSQDTAIAVGVSGGPDSVALAWLLKDWAAAHNKTLHVLTVDHGLRAESAQEALGVQALVSQWPQTIHHTLQWQGDKPETRLLEEARRVRYALMQNYCATNSINCLFLAHHQDDQAETFLLRLAKGSGVDGLAAMQRVQALGAFQLIRPLLSVPKDALIDVCVAHGLTYVCDPTNEKIEYARPRLRAAYSVLAEEGLTTKRLATTAMRMGRARLAFETITAQAMVVCVEQQTERSMAFSLETLRAYPEEIVLRVMQRAIEKVSALSHSYPPRLEKVETLTKDIYEGRLTTTTTLAGCLFVPDQKNGLLWVKRES